MIDSGYASWESIYDERGNEIKRCYFGVDGKPVLHKDGNAGWEAIYDERGNEIKRCYFGVDGKPILHKDGYAAWESIYDERGNEIKCSFFGIDGKPVLNSDGYSIREQDYDEHGSVTEIRFLGTDGAPILKNDEYARMVFVYRKDGTLSEEKYLDLNDNLYFLVEYNDSGEVIRTTLFDEEGNAVKGTVHDSETGISSQISYVVVPEYLAEESSVPAVLQMPSGLRYGMTREQVRERIGEPDRTDEEDGKWSDTYLYDYSQRPVRYDPDEAWADVVDLCIFKVIYRTGFTGPVASGYVFMVSDTSLSEDYTDMLYDFIRELDEYYGGTEPYETDDGYRYHWEDDDSGAAVEIDLVGDRIKVYFSVALK